MSSGWGQPSQGRQQKKPKTVYITHFPKSRSPHLVVEAVMAEVRRSGADCTITKQEVSQDKTGITLYLDGDANAVTSCNGMFVFNQRIWITKFDPQYADLSAALVTYFSENVSDGQVDMSDLKKKLVAMRYDKSITNLVNFNNRDFLEIALFMLGVDSYQKEYLVESLVLSNNNIQDPHVLQPYLPFLLSLRTIVLTGNPVKQGKLPKWQFPMIVFAPGRTQSVETSRRGWGDDDGEWL